MTTRSARSDSEDDDGGRAGRRSPLAPRRGRRGGRGRRKELEATFDHGESDGYGLWLDAAVKDNPVYTEHWAGKRDVTVRIEADQIVIRRAGAERRQWRRDESDDDSDRLRTQERWLQDRVRLPAAGEVGSAA